MSYRDLDPQDEAARDQARQDALDDLDEIAREEQDAGDRRRRRGIPRHLLGIPRELH